VNKLGAKLELSDAQKAQINPLLGAFIQQARAINADSSLSDSDRNTKLADLERSAQAQIELLLNRDQKVTFDKTLAQADA